MKNLNYVNYVTFRRKVGNYLFIVGADGLILVVYKRFSQPNELFIIRSLGKNLAENFLNAAKEVKDITEMDVIVIAFQLGIVIPNPDGQLPFYGGQKPFCGGQSFC